MDRSGIGTEGGWLSIWVFCDTAAAQGATLHWNVAERSHRCWWDWTYGRDRSFQIALFNLFFAHLPDWFSLSVVLQLPESFDSFVVGGLGSLIVAVEKQKCLLEISVSHG